jgi:hypothetical protein
MGPQPKGMDMNLFLYGTLFGMYASDALGAAGKFYRSERKNGRSKGVAFITSSLVGAFWPILWVVGSFIKDGKITKN